VRVRLGVLLGVIARRKDRPSQPSAQNNSEPDHERHQGARKADEPAEENGFRAGEAFLPEPDARPITEQPSTSEFEIS
jgi:hypothetical protein